MMRVIRLVVVARTAKVAFMMELWKCVSESHVRFVGPGKYISPPSSETVCGRKRLSSVVRDYPVMREFVEGVCLMSEVVVLKSRG